MSDEGFRAIPCEHCDKLIPFPENDAADELRRFRRMFLRLMACVTYGIGFFVGVMVEALGVPNLWVTPVLLTAWALLILVIR